MKKYQGVAVNYWNTRPFIHGMNLNGLKGKIEIQLEVPAVCGKLFFEKTVDFALLPVGALVKNNHCVMTDYCIGAENEVYTVALFSPSKMEAIKKIYLDDESMTSVLLCQILCKHHWNIEVVFESKKIMNVKELTPEEAILVIGDKCLSFQDKYQKWDLAIAWKEYTGLPFVFAVWVAQNETIKAALHDPLNESFQLGLEDIDLIIKECHQETPEFPFSKYFKENISYSYDEQKRKGMAKFLHLAQNFT